MRRLPGRQTLGVWALLSVVMVSLAGPSVVSAQAVFDGFEASDLPAGFGHDTRAYQGYERLERGRLVAARETAEAILADDPDSFAGHFLLGAVLSRAEGNLPRALYHLKQARTLFEARYGAMPMPSAPWRWHAKIIEEMAFVAGSLGLHEQKIRYLLERDSLYEPAMPADRGWPLMRLRRYDEARRAAAEGLATGDPIQAAVAYTARCAIEAEEHRREQALAACQQAAQHARELGIQGPTVFTNAAEAALGMLRLDEAERLILEGSEHWSLGTVSNPWMDLTLLYLGQGRVGPGLDALRRMFAWRNRQPAFVDVQNRSEIDLTAVAFLLVAGEAERATQITGRVRDRPDRTGFTSSEQSQLAAAGAVLDSVAHRLRAAQLDEEASWQRFWPALKSRASALHHRLTAALSARRAASSMAQERMLEATVRPYLAGSVEMPEWLEPELIDILGPGLLEAVLARAREQETLPGAASYLDVFAAEIALDQGRAHAAMDRAALAGQGLPQAEVLLRARVAAVGARAALAAGDRGRALAFLDQALQLDPGMVRRFDLALPAVVVSSGGAMADHAASLLRGSPRLARARGEGYRVEVRGRDSGIGVSLLDVHRSVLARGEVRRRAGESDDRLARRLAAVFHRQAFAPRVDLTEADLRSLDGSATAAGGRSAERIKSVLENLTEDPSGH